MQGVKAIISAGMMSTKTRVGRETAKAANAELRLKGGPNMEKQLTVGGTIAPPPPLCLRRLLIASLNMLLDRHRVPQLPYSPPSCLTMTYQD